MAQTGSGERGKLFHSSASSPVFLGHTLLKNLTESYIIFFRKTNKKKQQETILTTSVTLPVLQCLCELWGTGAIVTEIIHELPEFFFFPG